MNNMKKYKSYIMLMVAMLAGSAAMTSCQDDFDKMDVPEPVATKTPNTTINELKTLYWDDAVNYAEKIGSWDADLEAKAAEMGITAGTRKAGDHLIISGRVISSDEAGNVFKSLVIQDETGALAMSINSYNLYLNYRRGQQIVLDVTDMYIGKYNGLQQLGMPEWYENGNAYETSFMGPQFFTAHVELNGWPEINKIDTLQVNSFDQLSANPAGLRQWQSQLVKFNNVEFQNGGTQTFSEYHSSGVNQNIVDINGSTLPVRTSGYSNFWNKVLPAGRGDVVAICSYYGTTGWQLILIDEEGCMNFGNPTMSSGTKDKPYTVAEAVKLIADGTPANSVWVSGYIVGAVAPEIETVSSNADIEWQADVTLANTLVIGETADTKDLAQCVIISLPSGSPLRELGNLRSNPDNYKKAISVRGNLGEYMGTNGILGNTGAVDEFTIEGVSTGVVENGDGTEANPYSVSQIVAMNPSSTTTAVETGVWVSGYIVGSMPTGGSSTTLSGTNFNTTDAATTNMVIAPTPGETDYTKCIGIQLPTNMRDALALANKPGNLGKLVKLKGDVMKYCGGPGLKNLTEYKLDDAGSTPATPADPVTSIDETFDTGSIPSSWTQVQVAGNKTWYTPSFDNNYYAAMTGYKGTAPFDQWLITPPIDLSKMYDKNFSFDNQVNGYGSTTSKLEVYVLTSNDPAAAAKTQLNPTLATAPASGYSSWVNSGNIDLSQLNQSGIVYIGFRYYATTDANYATWCIDNVKVGKANGSSDPVTPPTPPTPSGDYKGDFNSFNSGTATAYYGEYTNATGWTAKNCNVLSGSDDGKDSNPKFTMFGSASTLAVCLNGKVGSAGVVTSPTLSGGLGTLTFNYGFPYNETKCQFTVNIKQNGAVVKTQTVTLDTLTKFEVYSFSMTANINGDYVIEIVNDSYSAKTSNSDRVAIWNLTWN